MKNEKKKLVFVMLLVLSILASCGKSPSKSKTDTSLKDKLNPSESIEDSDLSESNTESVVEEMNESQELVIRQAHPFSDGFAWIQFAGEENWKCINENGDIVFEKECISVDNFVNGYAIIDNSLVINSKGEEIYDFSNQGYELFDDRALDVGFLILSKDIDTYEKSGTFLYSLNLVENKIEEIDFSDCSYYTTNEWSEFYKNPKMGHYEVKLCDYLGYGYFTLEMTDGYEDSGYSQNFQMIQWYDVKNNSYVNIDSGVIYDDDALPNITIYFNTSDKSSICAFIVGINKMYFIDLETCSIKNVVDAYIDCIGYTYRLINIWPEDYLFACYDPEDLYNTDSAQSWFLDIDSGEKFTMNPEFDEYEIICYDGNYLCVSLVNDIGTHYIAVVDKNGKTVFEPVAFDYENEFKPCFFGDNFIYYDGTEMCFVNMSDWKITNKLEMTLNSDNNINDKMCLIDVNSPDVKYFVNFDTNSYYLPDGSEVAIDTDLYPTVISSGKFESILLVWDDNAQCYQFLNNNLEPFHINQ